MWPALLRAQSLLHKKIVMCSFFVNGKLKGKDAAPVVLNKANKAILYT